MVLETPPLRLLIVDDHEVVRAGLAGTLETDPRFEVVAAVGDGKAALAAVDRFRPDAALVDLRLPDTTGDRLCGALRERHPGLGVVILSSYVSEDTVRAAMDAGASAYVTKSAGLAEVRRALLAIAAARAGVAGERQIVDQLHRLVTRRSEQTGLTPQQQRVLELSAEGLTYREIGSRLYLSESTVRFHVQKLKVRFGARTKTDLIARAIRADLLSPAPDDVSQRT